MRLKVCTCVLFPQSQMQFQYTCLEREGALSMTVSMPMRCPVRSVFKGLTMYVSPRSCVPAPNQTDMNIRLAI